MPYRDWRFRIQDIMQASVAIQMRIAGMTYADFISNETIVKAVFYDFLIIGEAAINIPSEIQQRYPNIPWRIMGDMRNVMAHEYFQINSRVVWDTIENNIPQLMLLLQDLIEREAIGE